MLIAEINISFRCTLQRNEGTLRTNTHTQTRHHAP